jgi:hypothetical protein
LLHKFLGASPAFILFAWLHVAVTAQSIVHLTSVAVAPACPAGVGTAASWNAAATGGTGPIQYRFWLRNETAGTWTSLSGYDVSASAAWTSTAPGTYFVQVWARSAGSAAAWEDWRNSLPCVVGPAITSVSLQPAATTYLGDQRTWTVAATGGTPPLQYRFWLREVGAGTWHLLQDYSTGATASWTPTAAGSYYVQAWVRSAGSPAQWEVWHNSPTVDVLGPPEAPEWTTVVRAGGNHVVRWPTIAGTHAYRVYWAISRQLLEGATPMGASADVAGPPFVRPVADPGAALYYRVAGLSGPLTGTGGPVAVSPSMQPIALANPYVTPSLWDVDGDGCLDMVGAHGSCDGTFEPYSLMASGLAGLFAPGRVNRDSRFADYDGDGHADIFTNVYSRADNPASTAIMHVGNSGGSFTTDPGIAAMVLGGFGETVLAADFDNDGDVDVFIPNYTHLDDGALNRLLINDGAGQFTDQAKAAGVAINLPYPPEAAQAIDFDQDGWIDIHVASRIYVNNRNLTFTDVGASVGLPQRFDEGMRLFDVDLDGDFDLVHHDGSVTRLYRNVGGRFDAGSDLGVGSRDRSWGYGLNVCDVNGDAFEDLVVAYNRLSDRRGVPQLLVNVGGTLMRSDWVTYAEAYNDLLACADLDLSGMPDVLVRTSPYRTLLNRTSSGGAIKLRVLGADGQRNQQGHVVRVQPAGAPGRTIVRVIESGSGYMAQGDYDLLIAAPWPGSYDVAVFFAGGWFHTTAHAGDELTIYADRTVEAGLSSRVPRATAVLPAVTSGVVGGPITWTVAATGGSGPYTYKFLVSDGTSWTVGRDWDVSSSWTWSPPAVGTFRFQVWMRNGGSVAAYDAWRAFGPVAVTAPAPVAVTSLVASHMFPVPIGTPVTWTAGAVGGIGPYTYQFHVFDGASWTLGRDWNTDNTWTWIPPIPGAYLLQVWVRAAGSQNVYDAWRGTGPVDIAGPAPLAVASLDMSPSTAIIAGTTVTFTAAAVGGSGPYTYQFWIRNGPQWSIAQPWSASNTCTVVLALPGSYEVQAWVRNGGSSDAWDAWRGLGPFAVIAP